MEELPALRAPGVLWRDDEAHFLVRSEEAERIDLCLFDPSDPQLQSRAIPLERRADGLWETLVTHLRPGALYAYRAHGPWDPGNGLRFNPAKLLLDPMAAAISGDLVWHGALSGSAEWNGQEVPNTEDSAPFVPRSVIVDPSFDWQGDLHPRTPWNRSVIYECHVRGLTLQHPRIPDELRGRYLGLGHEAVVEYLLELGVTAVELLPVQHFVSEHHLHSLGLKNYYGYNPIGWMAPHGPYASQDRGQQVDEFKTMVRSLHRSGLEVLLDVVFNHTAEGNEHGPTLSQRGIDNRQFYRLVDGAARHYENFSGCGNTVHFGRQEVIDQALACLRYWVSEMHVDGFRFDLAPVLGREAGSFDADSTFMQAVRSDPVLRHIKLIAEPWDVGPHGYCLGKFPSPWREWNDRFRDATRSFWRGDRIPTGEVTQRLEGSRDLIQRPAEYSPASINFVTSHDGFTLQDLVSYENRHNWANGEENRDGHPHNLSRNWGVEGPAHSVEIEAIRNQMMRNLTATAVFSASTPMLSHGDELGRTQLGNNNAYCQDNPLTWVDWDLRPDQQELLEFSRQVVALRHELDLGNAESVAWLSAHSDELHEVDLARWAHLPFGWLRRHPKCVSLTLFNADGRGHLYEMPRTGSSAPWWLRINTTGSGQRTLRGRSVRVPARAILLLTQAV